MIYRKPHLLGFNSETAQLCQDGSGATGMVNVFPGTPTHCNSGSTPDDSTASSGCNDGSVDSNATWYSCLSGSLNALNGSPCDNGGTP